MTRRLTSPFISQERILGGAAVLAITQLLSSISGLIRDRTLASTFPELNIVDVYVASFRPSDLLLQMFVMAAFSVALVPLLARFKNSDDQEQMNKLLSGVLSIAAIIFALLALALALALPQVAPLLTQFQGESVDLYITFGRLALLTNFLFVFGNAFGYYLITVQRYWVYGLTPIVYNLGTIAGTLYLTPTVGPFGPIYGTVFGAVLYALWRFIAAINRNYRLRWTLWHPGIAEVGKLMIPRILALGALQLELLLFDRFASGLGAGAVTINAYARNFQSVAVGLAGVALAQSAYSLLSQAAGKREAKRFWVYLRKGILLLLALTIPGSILLAGFAPLAAWLVNLTHVLPFFAASLIIYCIAIPFESINHLLLRSYYSLKNTVTPAVYSVINGIAAVAVTWWLIPEFGVFAIAIGFTVGQVVQMIGLGVMLPGNVKKLSRLRAEKH